MGPEMLGIRKLVGMRPAKICGWLGMSWMAWATAQAASELWLDVSTARVVDGRLTIQFQSTDGASEEFRVEVTDLFRIPLGWRTVEGAMVQGIGEGIHEVTVPVAGWDQRFLRVVSEGQPPMGPGPMINEVMTDNETAHALIPGRYWDWIEIHNPHDELITLTGYGLSDDPGGAVRWVFPEVTLQPGSHVVVYATEETDSGVEGLLTTGFGLAAGGETLVLSDRFGREVDRFAVPPLGVDQSVGRVPDGGEVWGLFGKAGVTPGWSNGEGSTGVVVESPRFSVLGGIHAGAVEVEIEGAMAGHEIRYTTDGSPATALSPRLLGPIRVEGSRVLRAVAVDGAGRLSQEVVHSYLIGVEHGLPVVSIAATGSNFDFEDGWLTGMGSGVLGAQGQVLVNFPFEASNAWRDRELAIHVEMFEPDGTVGLRQHAGMKVHGGWGSRGYPQKSFSLYARRKYGSGSFRHAVFPGSDVDRFESLVLRNSGNDNQSSHQTVPRPPISQFGPTASWGSYFVRGNFTLLRDAMMQRLLGGLGLDGQAYRPAVLYVNGQYWGIHNIREKLTSHHVEAHHELPEGSIDLIEGYGSARAGTGSAYIAMRDYINGRNLTTGTNYQHVAAALVDVDNFIDYHLAVAYFQNFDIGNVKSWRPRVARGRFRWMVYDQDYGFNLWPAAVYPAAMARDYADYGNMFRFMTAGTGTSTAWPNGGGRTLLLRRLLTNGQFREQFIRRCADLLNTSFRETRVEGVIHGMASVIRPEIPSHLERWSWPELVERGYGAPHQQEPVPFTSAVWEGNIAGLVEFGNARPGVVRAQCISHFSLSGGLGTIEVRVDPPGAGQVRVNTIVADGSPWTGIYFGAYPTTLRPLAKPGHRFVGWTTPTGPDAAARLDRVVGNGVTNGFTAHFEAEPAGVLPTQRLWITEINYHSAEDRDTGDWIEIHNPGDQSVDLDGWTLRDQSEDGVLMFPAGVLPAGGYRVVCRNRARFQVAHPGGPDPIAEMPFGLDNGGDRLRLMDPMGVKVVDIRFDDRSPWPQAADGGGSTLQLVRPELAHGEAAAWGASEKRGGTPGAP